MWWREREREREKEEHMCVVEREKRDIGDRERKKKKKKHMQIMSVLPLHEHPVVGMGSHMCPQTSTQSLWPLSGQTNANCVTPDNNKSNSTKKKINGHYGHNLLPRRTK